MDEQQIQNLYNAYVDKKMSLNEEIAYERDVKKGLVGLPQGKELKATLIPFDKAIHKPKDIGLGGPSTEYTITELSPEGRVWNVPTIWWDEKGNPKKLKNIDALRQAFKYELETNLRFPRYDSFETGDQAAVERSKQGGAMVGPLAQPMGSVPQIMPGANYDLTQR